MTLRHPETPATRFDGWGALGLIDRLRLCSEIQKVRPAEEPRDVAGGVWRQTRRGRHVVDHAALFRETRLKRDAVAEYLNDRGVTLDERPPTR